MPFLVYIIFTKSLEYFLNNSTRSIYLYIHLFYVKKRSSIGENYDLQRILSKKTSFNLIRFILTESCFKFNLLYLSEEYRTTLYKLVHYGSFKLINRFKLCLRRYAGNFGVYLLSLFFFYIKKTEINFFH